jgi:hypothetical protein
VLQHADLLVLPSLYEDLSSALIEAMAAGLPVVATRVGGTADLVRHGVNGLLVAPRDPAALAAAISQVLADRGGRPDVSRRAAHRGRLRLARPGPPGAEGLPASNDPCRSRTTAGTRPLGHRRSQLTSHPLGCQAWNMSAVIKLVTCRNSR